MTPLLRQLDRTVRPLPGLPLTSTAQLRKNTRSGAEGDTAMANSQHNQHAGASPVDRDVPLSASAPDRRPPAVRGGRVQQAAPEDASAGVTPTRRGGHPPKKNSTPRPLVPGRGA